MSRQKMSNPNISNQGNPLLTPCPASPNCVSSLATDAPHQVEAFVLARPASDSWPALTATVLSLPRSKLVAEKPGYLHVEVRSLILRFVDHLELAADPESTRVEVRSASVIGYSDLGVNRKRVETLRQLLQEAGLLQ